MYADRIGEVPVTRFDLEDPTDLATLAEPKLALQGLRGLVIIDEIQRAPELFPVLRVLVDRPDNSARFLILGSASRDLIRQSSETLAGRIGHIELTPLQLGETGTASLSQLWVRGGFPPSLLAASEEASRQWRKDYVATFLDRDLPALGIAIPPPVTAPVLDDAGSLPRPSGQLLGAGALLRRGRHHDPRLPGHPRGHLHGAPASALARERGQAPGEVPETLLDGDR